MSSMVPETSLKVSPQGPEELDQLDQRPDIEKATSINSTEKVAPTADHGVPFQDRGVTRIETLYHVFGKGWGLYALWISIGLIAYVYSLSRSTTYVYASFATSAFGQHTVIGTIGVINGILGGVAPPFIAKLADVWSRPHALALSVALYAIGYAMCAGAKNVSTVVAGQFVYTLGNTGITFLNSLLIADITSLQWRAFANGAVNLPYVVNAFVAGFISSGISAYSADGWRWGYGMFCILLPVCMTPALAVLFIGDHKAKKMGLVAAQDEGQIAVPTQEGEERTLLQNICFYWNRLNITGLLLMGFGFALLLTPITLSTTAKGGYKNSSLIAMLVVGGVLFLCWCVWDGFFAEYPFMPKRVFNRTFVACVMVDFFYYSSSYLIDTYFSSWVYVIVDWSDRNYGFFVNTVSTAMCGLAVFMGLIMRYTHRYKYMQITGLCIRTIGLGLVYQSTKTPTDAYLVISQVLIGIGGSISVIASYIGVQGSVPHQDMAIATAVLNLISSIGSSITVAISSSVWNTQVPANLEKYLGDQYNATARAEIFGSIYIARLTEPRDLVKTAYMESTRNLFMAGLIVSFGSIIAGIFARNFYLTQAHNAIEPHKIIKFRNKEELEVEPKSQA